jgi:hypothetical protein
MNRDDVPPTHKYNPSDQSLSHRFPSGYLPHGSSVWPDETKRSQRVENIETQPEVYLSATVLRRVHRMWLAMRDFGIAELES